MAKRIVKIGDELLSAKGIKITVKKLLSARGGQGFVYLVDYGGKENVMKWYKTQYLEKLSERSIRCDSNGNFKKQTDPDEIGDRQLRACDAFYKNISNNAEKHYMFIGDTFVRPIDYIEWNGQLDSSFGYIMNLVDTETYKELSDYYTFNVQFSSRFTMLTCCLNIVEEFRKLHLDGFSYQDLNDGNICADPKTGNIFIMDNDNMVHNGVNIGVAGKERYMAPEVVLGNAPNKFSDRFSMALILFRLMMGSQHPFEGRYTQMNSEYVAYGKDPVFIFDEKDSRNAPEPQRHKNAMVMWPQYPDYIKELFRKTFKTAIVNTGEKVRNSRNGEMIEVFTDANREKRPIEEDWINALLRLRGELVECPKCKAPVFLSLDKAVQCPGCGRTMTAPCKIRCSGQTLPLVPGTVIYRCQIDPTCRDFKRKVAYFLISSKNGLSGFVNMTPDTWTVMYPSGKVVKVAPRGVAEFKIGMKIQLGSHRIDVIQ